MNINKYIHDYKERHASVSRRIQELQTELSNMTAKEIAIRGALEAMYDMVRDMEAEDGTGTEEDSE